MHASRSQHDTSMSVVSYNEDTAKYLPSVGSKSWSTDMEWTAPVKRMTSNLANHVNANGQNASITLESNQLE
jgi:hypothetical protein